MLKLLEALARSKSTPPHVALNALQTLLEVLPSAVLVRPREDAKPSPWLKPKAVEASPAEPQPAPATSAA